METAKELLKTRNCVYSHNPLTQPIQTLSALTEFPPASVLPCPSWFVKKIMTAFFPIPLAGPRLQLLVLVLILGVGPCIAKGPSIKCYMTSCDSSFGTNPDDCLRPAETGARIEDCPTGYCYSHVEFTREAQSRRNLTASSERRCATYGELTCLLKEPENCLELRDESAGENTTLPAAVKLKYYLENCVHNPPTPSPERSMAVGRSGNMGVVLRNEFCVCNSEALCNGQSPTLPKPSSGVGHLGYNGALVGALLVAVSPLRTMFLVG